MITRWLGLDDEPKMVPDIISSSINEGKYPTLEQIVQEVGESAVVPIDRSLMMNFEASRKNGFKGGSHQVNSMIRPITWQLGYVNPDDVYHLLVFHDHPEDYSKKTLAGVQILEQLAGTLLGEAWVPAVHSLTNWRTIVLDYLREEVPKRTEKRVEEITRDDILHYLTSLSDQMRANPLAQQEAVLVSLDQNLHGFQRFIQTLKSRRKLAEKDYARLYRSSVEYREAILSLMDGINPKNPTERKRREAQAEAFIDSHLTQVKSMLESMTESELKLKDDEEALFDKGRSPVFHAGRKKSYSDYLKNLFANARTQYKTKARQPYHPASPGIAKNAEGADNIRLVPSKDRIIIALQYEKTKMLIAEGEAYLPHLPTSDPYHSIMKGSLDFLKRQLVYRVIADNAQLSFEGDTNYNPARAWSNNQFIAVSDIVGKEFMEKFRSDLKRSPHLIALDKETGIRIRDALDSVVDATKRRTGYSLF